MKLSELVQPWSIPLNDFDPEIFDIKIDSRHLNPQELFCAFPGNSFDGRDYISEAFKKGAVACLYEPEEPSESLLSLQKKFNQKLIPFPNLKAALGWIAKRFYHQPTQHLTVMAVTGTNGKTSTCYLLTYFLRLLREPCGMIGTVGHGFNHALETSFNTTPDAFTLQHLFKQFLDQGCRYVMMEASSHGLEQGRMNGTDVQIALFTNLTRDHLDYHSTLANYQQAKQKLFEFESLKVAIINIDDAFGKHLLSIIPNHIKKYIYTLHNPPASLPQNCDLLYAHTIEHHPHGISAIMHTPWGEKRITTSLLGQFNLSNLLGVIAALGHLEFSFTTICELIKNPPPIPGRMQRLGTSHQPTVIVDYAHTPDALEQLLMTVRSHCVGKLKLIFGCGGDRDRGKRALMGHIASQYSDEITLTDDNPRTEFSEKIIEDILSGIQNKKAHIENNRKLAISKTIMASDPKDIIVIAGKGHELYQEIGTERFPFNDVDEAKIALKNYSLEGHS